MHRHALLPIALFSLLAAHAPDTAAAQDGTPPGADQDEALLPTSEQEDVVLRPTEQGEAMPGLDLPDPRPARGQQLPEGTVITGAQGIVVPLTTGGWAFVFDDDSEGDADPPMVLQPSMQTAAMLRLVQAREDTMTFRIAGEVQRYRGRHYLLPRRFDVVSGSAAQEQKPADERAQDAEDELVRSGDETADDLAARVELAERDQRRERSIPNALKSGEAGEAGEGGAASIAAESTLVVDVAGRVERDSSGLWVFTSDNDTDTSEDEPLSGPVTLVPCLMLQALERDLAAAPSRSRLSISGRVLVFEGQNFLLPTLYRLSPDIGGNLTTAQ